MSSPYLLVGSFLLASFFLHLITRRFRAISIAYLSGPPPGSWLAGNYPDILRPENVGDAEFAWIEAFGTTMKIKGLFGSDALFIVDPKALQWVLNGAGYNYPKTPGIKALIGLVAGKGLVWADGEQHARHRKIMEPSFSYSSLRNFLPVFQKCAHMTVEKWRDVVVCSESTSAVVNIPAWLARTTLDAIGAAAFDYDFGALEDITNNELAMAYHNLFVDSMFNRTDSMLAFEELLGHAPQWLFSIMESRPNEQIKRLHNYMSVARRIAKSLVDQQLELYAAGKEGGKDIMSTLVRANLSQEPNGKLGEEELLSQMTTLMVAGHETTALTISWLLYELSRRVDLQWELRAEIKVARTRAAQRGDNELGIADLDSMKYLDAIIKETLRFHPITFHIPRVAARDDVIPLSIPHTTKTGKTVTKIPISKGQRVVISLAGYNRLKSIWGEDADVWRPERFLEGIESTQKTGLGVLANLGTFSSGVRNCIGWRFALIQMQAMVVEFIDNFEFSPPPGNVEILRAAAGTMTPMVKGSNTGKAELPLRIRPVH